LVPTWRDLKACINPILRGTALGGALGVLPGTGPLIASFASYAVEKKLAPEASANASVYTHFIPMLSLGIPAGAVNALMLGALLVQGVSPGPQLMAQH